MNAPETLLVPRVASLDNWITGELDRINQTLQQPKRTAGWTELNRFFLRELDCL